MFELAIFILILIVMSIIDTRSMMKSKLKKEMIPYLIFIILSVGFGVFYLTDPSLDSLSYSIIKLFNLRGY